MPHHRFSCGYPFRRKQAAELSTGLKPLSSVAEKELEQKQMPPRRSPPAWALWPEPWATRPDYMPMVVRMLGSGVG